MNVFQAMNQLLRQDIIDLSKVAGANGFVYAWVKNIDLLNINAMIQETFTTILVLGSVFYTIFKTIDMFRHMRWAKQDRLRDIRSRKLKEQRKKENE